MNVINRGLMLFMALVAVSISGPAICQTAGRLTRVEMIEALHRAKVLQGRKLDSVREVCRLRLGARFYPVIATVERVTGIPEPRLYRHLIVLCPDLTEAIAFTYDLGVEPERCDPDRVYFKGGSVTVNQQQGSIVQFANGAADAWIVEAKP